MIDEFENWKAELLFTGNIVQDGDESVSDGERQQRFMRYMDMLEAIDGREGIEVARAIVQSIQVEDDYGAYQSTEHALGRFPSEIYLQAVVDELPDLIDRQKSWAGELLCGLANSGGTEWESDIEQFNRLLKLAPTNHRERITRFIASEESAGWLKHRVNVLGKDE